MIKFIFVVLLFCVFAFQDAIAVDLSNRGFKFAVPLGELKYLKMKDLNKINEGNFTIIFNERDFHRILSKKDLPRGDSMPRREFVNAASFTNLLCSDIDDIYISDIYI